MNPRPCLLVAVSCLVAAGLLSSPADARQADVPAVRATVETPAVYDDDADAKADADDPAIWRNRPNPGRSVVIGTLKNGGVAVYDLRGRLLQRLATPPAPATGLEAGRFNNVDLALGVRTPRGRRDLAVVSDRGRDRIRVFRIDARGSAAPGGRVLRDVTARSAPRAFARTEAAVEDQETAYGLAARTDRSGRATVVVSRRHRTAVRSFRLVPRRNGRVTYRRLDTLRLPSTFRLPNGRTWSPCEEPGERPQVEGMVLRRDGEMLYAAQEDVGVWRVRVRDGRLSRPRLVERVREYGQRATYDADSEECRATGPVSPFAGRHLAADAEGLTIAYPDRGRPVLLASSQGDSRFAAYRLRGGGLRHLGSFTIGDGVVDGVQHSDGSAVLLEPLGRRFPRGLFVTHDGEATPAAVDGDGEGRTATDFKLTSWPRVARAVGLR